MKRRPSRTSRNAFTLLELLLVVVIITILAVLFLPVLSKAKGRAKQIECLSQLKQVGLAAQQFTHEHGGRFPFQVPVKEGGTLELVQAASGLGDVQYAFRHFQALSNDLEIPKLLGCPADRRFTTNAVTFSSLRNEHISYFIAVTAEYSRPDSLLAGDRNIIARGGNSGSILRIAADTEVAWTSGGHEYKGNLLFAGGHVERTGNAGLKVAMQNPTGPVNAWIPTASSSGNSSSANSSSANSSSDSEASGSSTSGSGGTGSTGAGTGGGKSGGRGGVSSGFTALQNFFQSEQGSGNPTPVSPAVTPANPVYAAPESATVEQPLAALPPPEPAPAPKARMSQISPAASLPRSTPPVEAEPAQMSEPLPAPLAMFVEPERCWWCWILFLIVCLAAAITLGVLIVRQRQRRLHEASVTNLLRPRG